MERDLIKKIASFPRAGNDSSVVRGIGDDCAMVKTGHGKLMALTTDILVEKIHFDLAYFSAYHLGWKTAACNLSDMAAVGARPRWALLDLAVPPGLPQKFWESFSRGLFSCLDEWEVSVVGGDTVSSPAHLTTGLTMAGEVHADQWLGRDGARPGDLVFCSGYLGESACGLALLREEMSGKRLGRRRKTWWKRLTGRHLMPRPRVGLGMALARTGLATSCIDISDGLATDLTHVCEASGVKATVRAGAIPRSRALKTASRELGIDSLRLAVSGGEDFELLWTADPGHGRKILEIATGLGVNAFCIGHISNGSGVWLKGIHGMEEISFQGFEHRA